MLGSGKGGVGRLKWRGRACGKVRLMSRNKNIDILNLPIGSYFAVYLLSYVYRYLLLAEILVGGCAQIYVR